MSDSVSETQGQTRSKRAIDRVKDYTVFDVDIHHTVDTSEYIKYMDSPWDSHLEHVLRTNEPLASGVIGSFAFDTNPVLDTGLGEDINANSPEGLLAFMDRFNTDYVLLHENQLDFMSNIPEREYAAELVAASNDYLLDNYLDDYEELKGSIRVAPQAPRRAAEEIKRLGDETDMLSVHIPAAPNGLFGDTEFEPIFEAANDAGLPIDYHPSSPNLPWASMSGVPNLQSSVEQHSAMNQHMMAHIPSMIFAGIPEKYPDLQHIFLEGGVTWIPWLRDRMDKNYERRRHALPDVKEKPSTYLEDNFYFGTQPLEDRAKPIELKKVFDMFGAEDMLMYSSDYPHHDFDYPSVLSIPPLGEAAERKIFGGNALSVFDL